MVVAFADDLQYWIRQLISESADRYNIPEPTDPTRFAQLFRALRTSGLPLTDVIRRPSGDSIGVMRDALNGRVMMLTPLYALIEELGVDVLEPINDYVSVNGRVRR